VATENEDRQGLAAEYVLGTLDVEERRAADARIDADPVFRAEVAAWARRLQPLADSETPVAPRADTFAAIVARLEARPEQAVPTRGANIVALRRSIRRWRTGTAAFAALAAALLVVVVLDYTRPQPTEFVAMLTPQGGAPGFVVTVNTAANTLSIRRVTESAPSDKSYELWAVEPGAQPKSLGVIEQASFTRDLPYSPNELVFAISLEPKGGSPTGVATGPVVFSGPLVRPE
jgi:anti-sigma-K factor RskA